MLRVLYSKVGEPYVGPPTAFSFNVPTSTVSGMMAVEKGGHTEKTAVKGRVYLGGMCPRCEGRGEVSDLDLSVILDESKSLYGGAIQVPGYVPDGWMVKGFAESGFFDPDKPIRQYTARERDDLLYKASTKVKVAGINMSYEGLIPKLQKSIFSKDPDAMQPHIRAFAERAATFGTCRSVRAPV